MNEQVLHQGDWQGLGLGLGQVVFVYILDSAWTGWGIGDVKDNDVIHILFSYMIPEVVWR